jgi:glycosyltransferase involved in cell wall biosynthesis
MYNKVYYVVKSNLHYYPPCVSQIRMLRDAGVDVTVLYGSSENTALDLLHECDIETIQLSDPRGKLPKYLDKANNWLKYRSALKKFMRGVNLQESVFWFGNAESYLPMLGYEKKFNSIITYLELLDHRPGELKLLGKMSRRALAVITCEETRSYLMQYWFKLKKLPYTIPNKPYNIPVERKTFPSTESGQYIMEATKGHPFLIYQGMFQDFEYLEVIANVMKDHYPDMYLVMMGLDRKKVVDRVKALNPKVIRVDYIPAPLHLEVTSNANIGLLFYHPDCLNKAFCAPNKIFEYSYFGLPIIGNNIPGLQNTIGRAGAGYCTEFTYEKILAAFKDIENNYERYRENALKFFDSVDNLATIKQIVSDVGINTN